MSHRIRRQTGDSHYALPRAGTEQADLPAPVAECVAELFARQPGLEPLRGDLLQAYRILARALAQDGTIFLCGNGGSFADALHISGELLKSFERPRPLDPALARRLAREMGSDALASQLQRGLRSVVLGANVALASAVQNDFAVDRLGYAQELLALARPGDALLGLSTSGNAQNVLHAAHTARALGLPVVAFTGHTGGRLAAVADVALRAPAEGVRAVQELHQPLYHALCGLLEAHFFGRGPHP
jgi:D-sedoheptulose 7-phosphate isomerase